MKLYADITKVDEEQRMVFGYASTAALDSQGEIVLPSAIEKALPDYMRFANIREMHSSSAVGTAQEATMDEKGLYLCAKVVDENAWAKVKAKVYKGFSIGGAVKGRDAKDRKIITALSLHEISLVDRPANPEAVFDVFKADAPVLTEEDEPPVDPVVTVEAIMQWAKSQGLDDDIAKQIADGMIEASVKAQKEVAPRATSKSADEPAPPMAAPEVLAKTVEDASPVAAPAVAVVEEAPAVAADPVKKDMYTVQWLASLVAQLSAMRDNVASETAREGDGSSLPAKMQALLAAARLTLKDMVEEETNEEVDGSQEDADADSEPAGWAAAATMIKLSDESEWTAPEGTTEDVSKALTAATAALAPDVAGDMLKSVGWKKAGTVSRSERMQGIHDHSVAMGASCGAAKAAEADLQKVADELAKRDEDIAKLTGELAKAAERINELEAMPMQGTGKLYVVDKADEITLTQGSERGPKEIVVKGDAVGTISNILKRGGHAL